MRSKQVSDVAEGRLFQYEASNFPLATFSPKDFSAKRLSLRAKCPEMMATRIFGDLTKLTFNFD